MEEKSGTLFLSDVTKDYEGPQGTTHILRSVSLTVEPGQSVAIVGPSGSGKSTLLNIIGSLDRPTSGAVRLGDKDVTGLEGKDLAAFRANEVGFVFQDHHLLPQLTARENVLLPTIPQGRGSEALDMAQALLRRMKVDHRAEAFPAQMSGGERQRTAVARALINGARLLLCDEPTGSLDRDAGANIVSLLLELAEQRGVALLVVTHNMEHASKSARCFELVDGRLVHSAAHGETGK